MSKLAQLEFEYGSKERGRTVFDGILSKYPKRLDLLFVFCDKEIKAGDIGAARSLLQKKAESDTKLTDKQMKNLFRKWMRVEEEYGDEETQEHVKNVDEPMLSVLVEITRISVERIQTFYII
jgi:rRNA biogenesis protein RRP5